MSHCINMKKCLRYVLYFFCFLFACYRHGSDGRWTTLVENEISQQLSNRLEWHFEQTFLVPGGWRLSDTLVKDQILAKGIIFGLFFIPLLNVIYPSEDVLSYHCQYDCWTSGQVVHNCAWSAPPSGRLRSLAATTLQRWTRRRCWSQSSHFTRITGIKD